MPATSRFFGFFSRAMRSITADGILLAVILLSVVINGTLFFIPGISTVTIKSFVLVITVFGALIIASIQIFRQGIFSIPRDHVFNALIGVILALIASAIFSGSLRLAFFGSLGNSSTVLSILTLAGVFFLGFHVFKKVQHAMLLLGTLLGATLLLTVFHTIRFFFGPNLLVMGTFQGIFATPAGTWLDYGIILGITILTIALVLEFRVFRSGIRNILGGIGALLAVVLLGMNIQTVWVTLGFLSLFLIITITSVVFWNPEKKTFGPDRTLPMFTIILFAVSVIGIFLGPKIQSLVGKIGTLQPYVVSHPTLMSTIRAGVYTLKQNPITGVSPVQFRSAFVSGNTFSPQSLDRIDSVSIGFGWIPTIITTIGSLGIIACLYLLFAITRTFFVMIREGFQNSEGRFLLLTFLSLGGMVTVFACIGAPSLHILALGSLFLGAWYQFFTQDHPPKSLVTVPFLKNPLMSFAGLVTIFIFLAVALSAMIITARMYSSSRALLSSIQKNRAGDGAGSIQAVNRALALWQNQESLRVGTLTALREIERSTENTTSNKNIISKQEIEQLSIQAFSLATKIPEQNPRDDRSWRFLGDIYRIFGTFGISGSYDRAIENYKTAKTKSPFDERITVTQARTLLDAGKINDAEALLESSLAINPTVDGLRFKAERALAQKNISVAEKALGAAIAIRPYDGTLYRDLGALYYRNGDYPMAESLFILGIQRAPSLDLIAFSILALEAQGNYTEATQARAILDQETGNADEILSALRKKITPLSPPDSIEEILETSGDEVQ